MGDSRWPLYAMIIATILNIIFDTLFSIVLGWGVAGVAWATLGAQFISGIILLARINTGIYGARITIAQILKPDGFAASNIARLGMPSGIQGIAMSLGGLVIMSFANNFGADFVTANAVMQRVDGFAIMPIMGLGMATTTFSGQNIGAGNIERTRKGIYIALSTILSLAVVMGVVMWFTGPTIMRIFNVSDHVLEIGLKGIRWVCFFYAFMGMEQCVAGAVRGAGAAMMPLINSFIAQAGRLTFTYVFAIVPLNAAIQAAVEAGKYVSFEQAKAAGVGLDGYMGIFYAMSAGMVAGAILNLLYFRFGNWQSKGIEQRRKLPVAPAIRKPN
jgi:putative MATE family efflux protein